MIDQPGYCYNLFSYLYVIDPIKIKSHHFFKKKTFIKDFVLCSYFASTYPGMPHLGSASGRQNSVCSHRRGVTDGMSCCIGAGN